MPSEQKNSNGSGRGEGENEKWSRDEIEKQLTSFSMDQKQKIAGISRKYAERTTLSAEGIRSDAVIRLLKKSCQRKYSIFEAYVGMMKSIASNDYRKHKDVSHVSFDEIENIIAEESNDIESKILNKDELSEIFKIAEAEFDNDIFLIFMAKYAKELSGKDLDEYIERHLGITGDHLKSKKNALKYRLQKIKDKIR